MYAVRRRICFPTVPVEFPTAFQFFVFCVYFGLPVVAGKISSFLSLSVNISKTVADTAIVTLNVMGFPLTPRSMTLDDFELL